MSATLTSPQSSYSEQGESACVDWRRSNAVSLQGNVTLPYRIELSTQFDAGAGAAYNVTTGTDNNGDGNFNDRPAYASAPVPGVYSTRFGLLTTNAVNGTVPRNLGTMLALIHLDMNLSRAFNLNQSDKDHPRTLTFNARSANLLNHTNVTAVDGPLFLDPRTGPLCRGCETNRTRHSLRLLSRHAYSRAKAINNPEDFRPQPPGYLIALGLQR
jgi:hypothetical protein